MDYLHLGKRYQNGPRIRCDRTPLRANPILNWLALVVMVFQCLEYGCDDVALLGNFGLCLGSISQKNCLAASNAIDRQFARVFFSAERKSVDE